MDIRTVDVVLAAAGIVGHSILLTILVRRRLLARLPVFATLIAFYLLRSAWLLAAWLPSYWVLIYLDPGLQLLLILRLGFVAFGCARLLVAFPVLMVISWMVAWYVRGSSHSSLQNLAVQLSMFVSAMWLLATLCLFLLGRKARVPLGIALGFAAYSAANIATEIVQRHFALHPHPALFTGLSFVRAVVYLGCLAAWSMLFLSHWFDLKWTRGL